MKKQKICPTCKTPRYWSRLDDALIEYRIQRKINVKESKRLRKELDALIMKACK